MKMSLQISEPEIISAVVDFIKTQGVDVAGKELKVDFINGRGSKGTYAEITLSDTAEVSPINIAPTQADAFEEVTLDTLDEEQEKEAEDTNTAEDSTKDTDNIFGS